MALRTGHIFIILFGFLALVTSLLPLPYFFSFKISKTLLDPKLWLLLTTISSIIHFRKIPKIDEILNQKSVEYSKWIFLFFFIHFTAFKLYSYFAIHPSGADFSHFDYALWNTSNGHFMNISIMEKNPFYKNLFGNHFSPILLLLVPFYWIFESHLILIYAQSITTVISLWVFYQLALLVFKKYKIKNFNFLSLIFTISLAYNPYFLKIFKYEYHHEGMYLCLLWWLTYNLIKLQNNKNIKNFCLTILSLILTLSVKEDAGIALLGLGLAFSFYKKKSFTRLNGHGISLAIMGLISFFLVNKGIMPLFQTELGASGKNTFTGFWGRYGTDIKGIVTGVLSHPHWVIKDLFTAKSFYLLYGPWLFIPFFSWFGLAALPGVIMAVTANGLFRELDLYYSSPVLPLVLVGFLFGFIKNKKNLIHLSIVILLINFSFGLGKYRLPIPNKDRERIIMKAEKVLKESRNYQNKVYITGHLLPHLNFNENYKRIWLADFWKEKNLKLSHILIAKNINNYPIKESGLKLIIDDILKSQKYQILLNDDDILFLRRK